MQLTGGHRGPLAAQAGLAYGHSPTASNRECGQESGSPSQALALAEGVKMPVQMGDVEPVPMSRGLQGSYCQARAPGLWGTLCSGTPERRQHH